jgi:nucleoid-associated protein YgaU
MTGKPEKACIELMHPPGKNGGGGGSLGRLTFQFNPKEYTVSKSASWKKEPAKGAKKTSMPEFQGAEPRSLSVEFFLDKASSPSHDLKKDIEQLFKCCTPLDDTVQKNEPSPPFVIFSWGKNVTFTAHVKKVSAKYTLFSDDGLPIRAVCTLDLEELPTDHPRQNPTSGGLKARRTHTLVAGDTLPTVASAEYGDPRFWRAIAVANGIDDPLRLRSGSRLLIPAAEDAALMING